MRVFRISLLFFTLLAGGCSHPLDIIGEGDILSASGERDCLHSDAQAGKDNCTENLVAYTYDETYYGVAHPGWYFHRWLNYCPDGPGNACTFNIPGDVVTEFWGETAPPLVAIFRKTVNTGLNSLFIGHSFFRPFAEGMPFHTAQAGLEDHSQSIVFSGGSTGAPEALWENPTKGPQIRSILDGGEVELFAMTYHPDYPGSAGYENWIGYALAQNPDTRIAIALPWEPNPQATGAATYENNWHTFHPVISHGLIDYLRSLFPGVDIFCIPYGQSAVELRLLLSQGNLDDVDFLVSGSGDAIYRDALGHADDILVELGRLVWLNALYDVDLSTYSYEPGYIADLKEIAREIMSDHDPDYDAPYH